MRTAKRPHWKLIKISIETLNQEVQRRYPKTKEPSRYYTYTVTLMMRPRLCFPLTSTLTSEFSLPTSLPPSLTTSLSSHPELFTAMKVRQKGNAFGMPDNRSKSCLTHHLLLLLRNDHGVTTTTD